MTARSITWFEISEPRDFIHWTAAVAIVLAVHAALIGGFLLLGHPENQIGDDSSVVSIELDPIESTADAKQLNVAPAPEEMVEQKATPPEPVKVPDQPKAEEPPPPPDVVATESAPAEVKPVEKVEEQRAPAPITAAPVKGGAPQVAPSWQTLLVRKLQRYKRYPGGAQARNEQGTVLLSFTVDRNGRVLAHRVVHSSGHTDLDNEVMAMIERAQPLPPFPRGMDEPQISLTVPIRFSLH